MSCQQKSAQIVIYSEECSKTCTCTFEEDSKVLNQNGDSLMFASSHRATPILRLFRSLPRIHEVRIPQEKFLQFATGLRNEVNQSLHMLRNIASGRDLKKFTLSVLFILENSTMRVVTTQHFYDLFSPIIFELLLLLILFVNPILLWIEASIHSLSTFKAPGYIYFLVLKVIQSFGC